MRTLPAFFFQLAVALFLCGTALHGAEHRPASQDSVEGDLNAAVALMLQGEIDGAIAAVRPHLATDGRAVALLFDAGMTILVAAQAEPPQSETQTDLLDASTTLFRAILAEHPDHVRVRLELARIFFLQGKDGLARRHFERALAADPPAPVVANVNRHLAAIRARKRWTGHFGFTLAPDTNIGAASANETVLIDVLGQRLPFTLDDGGEQSGVGLMVWAGGEREEPLASNWRLRLGGDFFRREYSGSRFDRMGIGGHVGPRWLIGPRTEASLLLAARREWQGDNEPTTRSLGARLEASRRFSPRLSGRFGASWTERRHDAGTSSDGPVQDLSGGLSWAANPVLQLNARAGWGRERPELETLRNRTRRLSIGASAALPRAFSVSGTLTGRWTDYEGPGLPPTNVVDGDPREDVTRSVRVAVLKRDLTLRGFSPQLAITHERRASNAQQADYRRTGAEISFQRQF